MKKVIYTCLTGAYDSLLQPLAVDDEFDYICFSDSLPIEQRGVWQVRPVPFSSKDKVLLSRFPKMQPHLVLPEYDYSVYLDANLQITDGAFYECVNQQVAEGALIAQVPHPHRQCIYQELYACWHHGLISLWCDIKMRYLWHKMGMPENYGLMENNLILRQHNHPKVKEISNAWWQTFKTSSVKRDQLSLMPIYWQRQFMPVLLFGEGKNTRNVDCLTWHPHEVKRVDRSSKSAFEMYLMRLSNGAERRGWL